MIDISEHRPIDCDVHVVVPHLNTLLDYMDDYWRDHFVVRGSGRLKLQLTNSPPNAPISARPDWRLPDALPGTDLGMLKNVLDSFNTRAAICNCIHWSQVFFSEDMTAALCSAVNRWIAEEWLNRDSRLRASILIPLESPELAVREIERWAHDPRFVQILMLAAGEMPLGRRRYWPIYERAAQLGMPIGIHAGSTFRFPPSPSGWHSYFLEDYVLQSLTFQSQLLSLLAEGVFTKFPSLKVVMMESGFTWLPGFLWRVDKTWRGVRREVPWLSQPPSHVVRQHVRFTTQPLNSPGDEASFNLILDQIESDDMLMFSTDYPHWHFDGNKALPDSFPQNKLERVLVKNALETYPRLKLDANVISRSMA